MKNLYDDMPNGYQETIEKGRCMSGGPGGRDIFILTDILMLQSQCIGIFLRWFPIRIILLSQQM